MANKTGIAWTDLTWNPTTGCTKVSAGCKHCYAERIFHRPYPGRDFTDVRTHPDRLDQPLRIRKPQRIFVNSMSDLFHEDIDENFIDRVFSVMAMAPQHTFQILTKRPRRMLDYLSEGGLGARVCDLARNSELAYWAGQDQAPPRSWPLPNVWLGVSTEDQETADERIPLLLQTPAAKRFVSYEPALGPVDFHRSICKLLGELTIRESMVWLDWLICGGESGPGARGFDIQWARSVRDQCEAAGTRFFMKQTGANVRWNGMNWREVPRHEDTGHGYFQVFMRDRAGADPSEWPADLRCQEFPA